MDINDLRIEFTDEKGIFHTANLMSLAHLTNWQTVKIYDEKKSIVYLDVKVDELRQFYEYAQNPINS